MSHSTTSFQIILDKFRKYAFSERDKGEKFERLMQGYLKTDPTYKYQFSEVWMWNEFPFRKNFGGSDLGIDLVMRTYSGDYWAVQCKCFDEKTSIDKAAVDTFLSTSSKQFINDNGETTQFAHRLWISTTNKWSANATETIQNQQPPVNCIHLNHLIDAPVDWQKIADGVFGEAAQETKKKIREHQTDALNATHEHFKTADRGKLIMACGTGKTFTSLKIAEKETDGKGLILFLVPSIALLGQTLREWSAQADEPINSICICSDVEVSKTKSKRNDTGGDSISDLALPASTSVKEILKQFNDIKQFNVGGMTVVFSTYQSIEVIAKAQTAGEFVFDLIICDEAHRTTGVTLVEDDDESSFVKVHNNDFIQAHKRLYMTATPKLYGEDAKSKASEMQAVLCSMDDVNYGDEIYRIGFGEAVKRGLLSDYKVLILTMSEDEMSESVQRVVSSGDIEINATDAAKLIGCINALSKNILGDADIVKTSDPEPMRRAVAFCQNIAVSKQITNSFSSTQNAYMEDLSAEARETIVNVNSRHIDGTMGAPAREELLQWLKAADAEKGDCRVLTNVRCLSEGVDVPSLDAVMFLSPRNSQIEVVQSVGRVMRISEGKKYGYIIIPVVIPSYVEADKALDKNESFKTVWSVLNALRSHDDRFNATINKIELNRYKPANILVARSGSTSSGERENNSNIAELQLKMTLEFEQMQGVIFGRMVKKVGEKLYWEQWAKDVADIANRQIERIKTLIAENPEHRAAFDEFLSGLQKNINPSISEQEAIDMLSQHIITKPVFEALFEDYSFVKNNPISVSMQKMLDLLEEQDIAEDTATLDKFYVSVKERAKDLDNGAAKQKIIVELYDKFFKTAFPKMVEKLGIVYTPVEVVDFIIYSVDAILRKEFGRSVSDENVHILDPFTGTGTFITRLLQSGLIAPHDLERKYKHELHANEIVLLAYYIAAINIENAYHDLVAQTNHVETLHATSLPNQYTPFDGICLTDTFQLGETDEKTDMKAKMFPENSKRVLAQKQAKLQVIMGNPPYSIGQKSANDNAQNQSYPKLDARIAATYAEKSNAGLNKSLYDAYIKAFRWSTDRLDPKVGGLIAFVSNGAWLDGNSTDGFRKCLEKEFTSIYVFNLRGNCRTQSELRRTEGGNVFGLGSRTPITITFLVKNPAACRDAMPCVSETIIENQHVDVTCKVSTEKTATIHYYDIGDYLTREDKLFIVDNFKSIENSEMAWQTLQTNEHGDWLNQRNDIFETFIPIAPEKKFDLKTTTFFVLNAPGVATGRDSWVYNYSKIELDRNMIGMIEFYNQQQKQYTDAKKNNSNLEVEDFIISNEDKISWTRALRKDVEKGIEHHFNNKDIKISSYRPFAKQNLYFNKPFIESPGLSSILFPTNGAENCIIALSSSGSQKGLSALVSNSIADYHLSGDTQCFPLYYYEEQEKQQATLFDSAVDKKEFIRRDAVSDFILGRCRKAYGDRVVKEDIFYYVYGVLHSAEYRERFASDLKKMLPRLPLVDEPRDFWTFSKAGRALAALHLDYENVAPASGVIVNIAPGTAVNYRVEKMRFPRKEDKTIIKYNEQIFIENIPLEAYDYVVNGKSAIEWIMERYQITVNKDSGIRNDPNQWAEEQQKSRYILDLLLSIIRVSVETVEIVNGMPTLKFD